MNALPRRLANVLSKSLRALSYLEESQKFIQTRSIHNIIVPDGLKYKLAVMCFCHEQMYCQFSCVCDREAVDWHLAMADCGATIKNKRCKEERKSMVVTGDGGGGVQNVNL